MFGVSKGMKGVYRPGCDVFCDAGRGDGEAASSNRPQGLGNTLGRLGGALGCLGVTLGCTWGTLGCLAISWDDLVMISL